MASSHGAGRSSYSLISNVPRGREELYSTNRVLVASCDVEICCFMGLGVWIGCMIGFGLALN
jgi:hypothetical protein